MPSWPYSSTAAVRTRMVISSLIVSGGVGGVSLAADMEITPFRSFNQSPLIQIYGIPHDSGADIVKPGAFHLSLNQDLSSNYTVNKSTREQLTLDGETYRLTFAARYGVTSRGELGVEIPYVVQGGGFLDSFVIDWHTAFGLPQGGRDSAPKGRLNYEYRKDGGQKLKMDRSGSGIGDIALTGGFSLLDRNEAGRHDRLALKGSVKLPTGDSSKLRGSGGADATLQMCGSINSDSDWGSFGVYGSAGGLAMSRGNVLSEQHNPLAGVGSLGVGWGPASWISFKVQLNGSTPLYHDSALAELSRTPLVLIFGGALRFPGNYLLDIGVAEDVAVATAPDVSFHLGLSKQF